MLKTIKTDTATLDVVEFKDFECKRVFTMRGTKCSAMRGGHAHKKCRQIIHCVYGKIWVKIIDIGNNLMNRSLYAGDVIGINPFEWIDIEIVQGESIAVVYCDQIYDESDYIRDFEEFKKLQENS